MIALWFGFSRPGWLRLSIAIALGGAGQPGNRTDEPIWHLTSNWRLGEIQNSDPRIRSPMQIQLSYERVRVWSITRLGGPGRQAAAGSTGASGGLWRLRLAKNSSSTSDAPQVRQCPLQPNKRPPLSSMNRQGRRGDPRWVTSTLEPSVGARRNRSDLFPRGRGWTCSPPTTQR